MIYETVIGLEVHVELATRTKIFCGCSTRFGSEPNTQVCPVCAGLPGALPRLNQKVLQLGILAGLATDCRIELFSRFDRKHYFYPDLPKAYQISQFHAPLCTGGRIRIKTDATGEKTVRIREIHLEEDAGKLIHDPWTDATWIDLNRCGVPLIEIVSQPDMSSAEEAIAYLSSLTTLLRHTGVSDCKMEEGSIRADINLSVRPVGSNELGTRTEMKNMNSLKAINRAIVSETARQIDLLESGKPVIQQTRRWDESKGRSLPMRSKEEAPDYQYFPDPDLPAIVLSDEHVALARIQMPRLPAERRAIYVTQHGLSEDDAELLLESPALADWYETVGTVSGSYRDAANWILGDVFRWLRGEGLSAEQLKTPPGLVGRLIARVLDGTITRETGRSLLPRVLAEQADPEHLIRTGDHAVIRDERSIRTVVEDVLSSNKKAVLDYLSGKEKVLSFLTGQAMRQLGGKAPADQVRQSLVDMIQKQQSGFDNGENTDSGSIET